MIVSPAPKSTDERPGSSLTKTNATMGPSTKRLGLKPFGRPRGVAEVKPLVPIAFMSGATLANVYFVDPGTSRP